VVEGRGLDASAFFMPLFTEVRGRQILRTSALRSSPKFDASGEGYILGLTIA
jgi:hypothetical protein